MTRADLLAWLHDLAGFAAAVAFVIGVYVIADRAAAFHEAPVTAQFIANSEAN